MRSACIRLAAISLASFLTLNCASANGLLRAGTTGEMAVTLVYKDVVIPSATLYGDDTPSAQSYPGGQSTVQAGPTVFQSIQSGGGQTTWYFENLGASAQWAVSMQIGGGPLSGGFVSCVVPVNMGLPAASLTVTIGGTQSNPVVSPAHQCQIYFAQTGPH